MTGVLKFFSTGAGQLRSPEALTKDKIINMGPEVAAWFGLGRAVGASWTPVY